MVFFWPKKKAFHGLSCGPTSVVDTARSGPESCQFHSSGVGVAQILAEVVCRSACGVKMDVSKDRGTPKWMVYNGKPYLRKLGCPSWSSLCFSRYWGGS